MTYHHHSVNLSKGQISKLARGGAVRLKHANLAGPHLLYLTDHQIKHLGRAHRANKGAQISMSHEQLRHHAATGGSIFDSLKSFGKKFLDVAAPVAKDIASSAWNHAKSEAAPILLDAVKSRINSGITSAAHKGGRKIRGKGPFSSILGAIGLGADPRRRKRKVRGRGWLDDILSPVAKIGATASHFAPLLMGLGTKRGKNVLRNSTRQTLSKRGCGSMVDDGMGLYA